MCAVIGPIVAGVQQTSFADIASGTAMPASLRIADIGPEYKAMRIHSMGESSPGLMGSLGGLMMMGSLGGGPNGSKAMQGILELSGITDIVWTKGQTTMLAGHEFLVAYKLNTGMEMAMMKSSGPKMAATLTLDLIRTDSVTSVAPDASITPDQLRKILTAAGATFDSAPVTANVSGDEATTAAVLLPVFAQAKLAAQKTQTQSNLKQIALSAIMYQNDWDDQFPYVESTPQFQKLTAPYLKNADLWKSANPNGAGFRFAMNLAGVNAAAIDRPAEAPLVYEVNPWADGGRVVAFADGHTKYVGKEQWPAVEAMLLKKYAREGKKPIKG